ncbi:MAG: hypothetical protein K2M03_07525 [Muribaculaceae bacterium]|nr:hypothetical protein [Muribaculaceae bacterium]
MGKYKVRTISSGNFDRECARLESQVRAGGYTPDCVIGIESGGRYVAERMFMDVPHLYTRLQRDSTGFKSGHRGEVLKGIFRFVPRFCLNRMRKIEAKRLSESHHALLSDSEKLLALFESKCREIRLPDLGDYRRILIVDDAVDSGMTMVAVLKRVRDMCGQGCDVRTAVVTVTEDSPLTSPDYTLYNNKTLIRFPWSLDS